MCLCVRFSLIAFLRPEGGYWAAFVAHPGVDAWNQLFEFVSNDLTLPFEMYGILFG